MASEQIPLWPNGVPRRIQDGVAENTTTRDGIQRVAHVHEPTLIPFPAPAGQRSGTAVVICPGGGYAILAIEHEGYDIARWFNANGISAFVVKYRMSPYRHPVPLMDAQQALRLVRSRSGEWGVRGDRIGIMGFSAGGHLASTAATHGDRPVVTDGPLADVSCRPDFAILGYPVVSMSNPEITHGGSRNNLLGPDAPPELCAALSAELQVGPGTPPMFFFHATNDKGVQVRNSEILAEALTKAGIAARVALQDRGGHGFGIREDDWAEPCLEWLCEQDLLDRGVLEPTAEVRGWDTERGVLVPGTRAFSNRNYIFDAVPEELRGLQFTRLAGGVVSRKTVTARQATTLFAATATHLGNVPMDGWTPLDGKVLHYTDRKHTAMQVFSRSVAAGERIDIADGNWTGVVLMARRLTVESTTPRPDHSRVPGVVIDHIPARTGRYVGSPSIAILPNGDYLASHDIFGPAAFAEEHLHTRVFRSGDRGAAWAQVADLEGQFWSTLFTHRGAVYIMGVNGRYGDTVIRRSDDGGSTWTVPKSADSGLLLSGQRNHCAPVPVIVHNGRIWRAMEDSLGGKGWGRHFRCFMMSAPVDADLLEAQSWTCSNPLAREPEWLDGAFGGWLEGNAVAAPDGTILDILRADVRSLPEQAAVVRISPDGKQASFDPDTGFIDFPGGCKKFTIRFDPESRLYWALSNYSIREYDGVDVERIRNTLALSASADLRTWEVRTLVLHHPDPRAHGFQYPDWQFDGADIVAVSRTAYDDGMGGAHNQHDANYLTFHRITGFRSLTMADSTPAAPRPGNDQEQQLP